MASVGSGAVGGVFTPTLSKCRDGQFDWAGRPFRLAHGGLRSLTHMPSLVWSFSCCRHKCTDYVNLDDLRDDLVLPDCLAVDAFLRIGFLRGEARATYIDV